MTFQCELNDWDICKQRNDLPWCWTVSCPLCDGYPHICYCRHAKFRSWSRFQRATTAPSPSSFTWKLTEQNSGSLSQRCILAGSSTSSTQTQWKWQPWMEGRKSIRSSSSFKSDGESSQFNICDFCLSHLVQWQKQCHCFKFCYCRRA